MTNPEILDTADPSAESDEKIEKIIQEIISIERRYYNEKRNVKEIKHPFCCPARWPL